MKHTFTLLLTAMFCTLATAQDATLNRSQLPRTVYYSSTFNTYPSGWDKFETHRSASYIKDGKLYYEARDSKYGCKQWNAYNIDQSLPYYVELEFAITRGPDNKGSGLVFNLTGNKEESFHMFSIAPNNYYIITKAENGKSSAIKEWTKITWVKPTGNNKLGLLSKNDMLYFYVNDHLVYSMKRPAAVGCNMGIGIPAETTMAVDKFTIRYDAPAVNDVDDTIRGYQKLPLGASINSNADNSFPVLSADGKLMFFSRSENKGIIGLEKRTLMYVEYNDEKKDWSTARALPANINQADIGLAEVVYVSADKKTIVIDKPCDANGKFMKDSTGLAICTKTDASWSNPENIPVRGLNTDHRYTSFTLGSNNRVLILALANKASLGERDLFVSIKDKAGNWSTPRNLGAKVNSVADEYSPCLAPDNVTLYYTSLGKPGYGRADVFMSRRLDDSWTNWTEAQNLGADINTAGQESSLRVDANGNYAYMNLENLGEQKGKICRIELPEAAKPKRVVIVSGTVYDMLTKKPIAAEVVYDKMETGNEEGQTKTGEKDGAFVIVLPYGNSYGLTANKEGYIAESKVISLKEGTLPTGYDTMSVEIYIMPLQVGDAIRLNNIFYAPDKFELETKSHGELDRLVEVMRRNPNLKIQIEGHTDKGGNNAGDDFLQKLSENRAGAIVQYLNGKGINTDRISAVGFGRTKPVSTTDQKLNRRVEIRVMGI